MKYTEIQIETKHGLVDLVSDAMFSAGAQGVKILDSADVKEVLENKSNWDYVDENLLKTSDAATVSTTVAFNDSEFVERLKNELDFLKVNDFKLKTVTLDCADWENEWKKYFKPIKTKHITVVPTWIDYKPAKGEKIIRLDPGMAFGTGEHATTRMCLEMLDAKDRTVFDIGCGSGILGISAFLLGAKSVYMCDFDDQAVEFAKRNAAENKADCKIEQADLLSKCEGKADLIFANITADILIRLSTTVEQYLKCDGEIVLSGIIDSREDEVKTAFENIGLKLVERQAEADWRAFRFKWN